MKLRKFIGWNNILSGKPVREETKRSRSEDEDEENIESKKMWQHNIY